MKKMPGIFKPSINKTLTNNNKIYYSYLTNDDEVRDVNVLNKKNIKQEVLLNKKYGYSYIIKTKDSVYHEKIVDQMGNNIIIESGKVFSISDIIGIYEA